MNFAKCKSCCNLFSFLVACAYLSSFVNCDEVLCSAPPQILNAHPDLQDLRPPFHNGTVISYHCVDGFVLPPGADLHVVCVAENETASWIYDENALCTQVCGVLPDIPHATLATEGREPPFHLGVKIRVRCDSGYIAGGSILQIECVVTEGNAVWNLPAESCKPKSCGFPGEIENAQRSGNVFTFPNNVTYRCNVGYRIRGRATLYCMPSGNWNPSLPFCEAIICPLLPQLQNGHIISVDRHHGAIVTYECAKGFRLDGPSQRTCGADSRWSGSSPTCILVTCLPPGELENGRVVNARDVYNFNDFVIFKCHHNKESHASKCLEDGQWSSRPPNCPGPAGTSKTETPVPPTADSISPPTNVTTGSPGNINESKCEDPGDIPHGKRTASGFTPGSNVTYTCEDGYDLRGKGTLVCLGTGKWDLNKLPICVKPIPTTVIVGVVVGIILVAVTGVIAYFYYRRKVNNPKGYGKKSKAFAADAADQEEIARLDKGKKPIPVTVL